MVASNSVVQTLSVLFQGILGTFGVSEHDVRQQLIPPAGYTCQAPVWIKRPQLKKGAVYLASMKATCLVYPQLGGDLEKLQAYTIEELKKEATIERGPIDTTFEGIPSKYLDSTVVIKGKDSVTIRNDVNVATDNTTKLVSSTISRKITGVGNGVYLKKLDSRVDVLKTAVRTEDQVTITFYSEVEKPWYAPEGMFLNEIESRVPGQFAKLRDKVVDQMSKNY
jgi:hypothetical protein